MSILSRSPRLMWLLGLVTVVVTFGGAAWILSGSTHATAATKGDLSAPKGSHVVCFGHVDVEHGVTPLYAGVVGRVTKIEVSEGDEVAAGAVLLRLDDELAKLRVREAQADLKAADEQLTQARKLPEQHTIKLSQQRAAIDAVVQRLAGAKLVLDRKRDLAKLQQMSDKEADAAEALVRELEAVERVERAKLRELELDDPAVGIKRAAAEVDARTARLEETRRGVDECQLRAPCAGNVLRVLVGVGEILNSQAKQPAITFCPKGPRLIRAEVEQEFANRVTAGQVASIHDDATAGPTWHGKVTRISDWYTHRRSILQEPFQFNDVRTLECLIALDDGQPPLRIGQRVRVTIGAP